jgi:hypothetical protein
MSKTNDTSRELTSDVRAAWMEKVMDDELMADELAHVSAGITVKQKVTDSAFPES